MELIPYCEFERLRLVQFADLPPSSFDLLDPASGRRFSGRVIAELVNWQFMGNSWIGEAIGFSEWLRLARDPEVLRSLSLDLEDLSEELSLRVLAALKLSLRRGMSRAEIEEILGSPSKTQQFVPDRKSYIFSCGSQDKYWVDCTIQTSDGLVYIVVMRADYE